MPSGIFAYVFLAVSIPLRTADQIWQLETASDNSWSMSSDKESRNAVYHTPYDCITGYILVNEVITILLSLYHMVFRI